MWNDLFYLDSTSPSGLRWKIKPATNIVIGSVAGCLSRSTGYWQVCYNKKFYRVHRVIWEMHYGSLPQGVEVDHADNDTTNNNISNLRLASRSENTCNRLLYRTTKTGIKGLGLSTSKGYKSWSCRVTKNGKRIRVSFPYTEAGKLEAIEWIRATRLALHGQFANHG